MPTAAAKTSLPEAPPVRHSNFLCSGFLHKIRSATRTLSSLPRNRRAVSIAARPGTRRPPARSSQRASLPDPRRQTDRFRSGSLYRGTRPPHQRQRPAAVREAGRAEPRRCPQPQRRPLSRKHRLSATVTSSAQVFCTKSGLPHARYLPFLETDAPYLLPRDLAPEDRPRGRRNEPAFLIHIGKRIASALGLSIEELAHRTNANARRLFGKPAEPNPGDAHSRSEDLSPGSTACPPQ